jgi:hypothetical protein
MDPLLLAKDGILFWSPGIAVQIGTESILPALAALFAVTARDTLRRHTPVTDSVDLNSVRKEGVFLRRPFRFVDPRD